MAAGGSTGSTTGLRLVPPVPRYGSEAQAQPAGQTQTPEDPRRWLPIRWVSTIPTASMSAYMVVGPTNVNPLLRRAFERAIDSGERVGTSSYDVGAGVEEGRK